MQRDNFHFRINHLPFSHMITIFCSQQRANMRALRFNKYFSEGGSFEREFFGGQIYFLAIGWGALENKIPGCPKNMGTRAFMGSGNNV